MVAVLSQRDTQVGHSAEAGAEPDSNAAVHQDYGSTIAINATRASDASRITRLLSFSGVVGSSICYCETAQLPEANAFAVVICHRRDEKSPTLMLPDAEKVSRVIVISDCTQEDTAVRHFNEGARHFFNLLEPDRVLQARLEAALRKHRSEALRSFYEGDIFFNIQRRRVMRAGNQIDLSPKEFEFACYLFSRLDTVVKNSELMTWVWLLPPHMDSRRIDTAACRVRKKLGLSREQGWELKRIRRVGYRLTRVEGNVGFSS